MSILEKMQIKEKGFILKKVKSTKKTSFSDHLDSEYGKEGSGSRKNLEKQLDTFQFGVIIREARIFRQLTQEELAVKSGTTKFYISRIENNASDIRLST